MTLKKSLAVTSLVLVAALSVAGCGKKGEEAPKQQAESAPAAPAANAPAAAPAPAGNLAIVQIGPQPVTAGQDFKVQPNGQSAMWAKAENVTPSTVIVLNNVNMKSTPKKEGNLITCFVPKEMYAKPGEYPIFLLDTKTGAKSNELKFVVK